MDSSEKGLAVQTAIVPREQSLSLAGCTLAGPDGSHLLGTESPHFIIGADSTGANHNIYLDDPLHAEDSLGATYHVGTQTTSRNASELNQSLGEPIEQPNGEMSPPVLHGYAAGMMKTDSPLNFPPNALASTSATNSLMADLTVRDVQNTDGAVPINLDLAVRETQPSLIIIAMRR